MGIKSAVSVEQSITVLLFLIVTFIGFMWRIDTMYGWQSSPEQFLVQGEPMVMNLDGYYYLAAARDVQQEIYSTVDSKRAYPATIHRAGLPPLLSVLIVRISAITGKSLNQIAVFVPAVFGICLGLPLVLFGYRWGGGLSAITALVIGLFAPIYASRTSLGVLDTDCLNVTFALCCAYFFMRFSMESGRKRYIFFSAGMISYLFFLWWWDQSPAAVTALSLSPLVMGLLFFYRPSRREGLYFLGSMCLAVAVFFSVVGWNKPVQLFYVLQGLFSYISKQHTGLYPNIGQFITEQDSVSLDLLMIGTAIKVPVFFAAVAGLVWSGIKKQRELLFLLPVFCVGLLSFYAMRFAVFLTPVIALGFGYVLGNMYSVFKKNNIALGSLVFIVVVVGWMGLQNSTARTSYFSSHIFKGMQRLQNITPLHAVVWSWWDEGHPLVYWADRATINDGMVHSGQRTHYTALPMGSTEPRFAANFMHFYTVRGIKGISMFMDNVADTSVHENQVLYEILAHGPQRALTVITDLCGQNSIKTPEEWLEFFYPAHVDPVYLFFDKKMLKQVQMIFWYGTWDVKEQAGVLTLPVLNLENIPFDANGYPVAETFSLNVNTGEMNIPSMFTDTILLSQLTVTDSRRSYYKDYGLKLSAPQRTELFKTVDPYLFLASDQGEYGLELNIPTGNGVLQDVKLADTVINRLFWRKNSIDSKYFKLVEQDMPYYQIWKVQGDKLLD